MKVLGWSWGGKWQSWHQTHNDGVPRCRPYAESNVKRGCYIHSHDDQPVLYLLTIGVNQMNLFGET